VLDLETAPGDGDPGLVAGRDSEGVPGMDICIESAWNKIHENQVDVLR